MKRQSEATNYRYATAQWRLFYSGLFWSIAIEQTIEAVSDDMLAKITATCMPYSST